MDLTDAPNLSGWIVFSEPFADGPARWYACRGRLVLTAGSQAEVVAQVWDEDSRWTVPLPAAFAAPVTELTPPPPAP